MILISRKKHESIIVSEDITVVVIEIRGDKVRLGIEGPRGMSIRRNEESGPLPFPAPKFDSAED